MKDRFEREIDYVRISVTDKCNLRCRYCMPESGICPLSHADILEFEEIARIVSVLAKLGIKKVKLTGGEPLVRRDIVKLVAMIKATKGIENISITTNGVLLSDMAEDLYKAGVDSVNISLDTLKRDVYEKITRRDEFDKVIKGIQCAIDIGMRVKINCVPVKEFNVGELCDIAGLAKEYPIDVRFIELMPIGCGKEYEGVSSEKIRALLNDTFGGSENSAVRHGNGPAEYIDFEGFKGSIGFISPISHKFCSECNRVRITADGNLKLCLHYKDGISLKELLRTGCDDEMLEKALYEAIYMKPSSHSFTKNTDKEIETNKMVQIGG